MCFCLVLSIDICFVFLNLVQVALPNVNQFTWELGAKFLRFIACRSTERQLVMVRKVVFCFDIWRFLGGIITSMLNHLRIAVTFLECFVLCVSIKRFHCECKSQQSAMNPIISVFPIFHKRHLLVFYRRSLYFLPICGNQMFYSIIPVQHDRALTVNLTVKSVKKEQERRLLSGSSTLSMFSSPIASLIAVCFFFNDSRLCQTHFACRAVPNYKWRKTTYV